jgi:hypothetical protein
MIDLPRFNAYIRTQLPPIDSLRYATLMHLSANDSKLAQLCGTMDEYLAQAPTDELMMLQIVQPTISGPVIKALLLSSLIDGRVDIIGEAMGAGIAAPWPWIQRAAMFNQNEVRLVTLLASFEKAPLLERCAFISLATSRPETHRTMSLALILAFCSLETARTFWLLVGRALTGEHKTSVAEWVMGAIGKCPELLYASPLGVDAQREALEAAVNISTEKS